MRRNPLQPAILVALFLLQVPVEAQRRPKLSEDVDLPANFEVDFRLASQERARMATQPANLASSYAAGAVVFDDLVKSPTISLFNLPYAWRAKIVDSDGVNAYSLPDGEIGVTRGLATLLASDRGLWAGVLSHEVAHTARRHWVKKFLYALYVEEQIRYYKVRAAYGDDSANWALLALRIAAPIAQAKLSRDLEHDADARGMMLMAQAGYHPDSVFALHHLMRINTGEKSRFGAFFSSHPRWQTRDERSERAYSDAMAEYNRLWPDPAVSPGGPPPVVAFLDKPKATENKKDRTADISIPLSCRNAREPVFLAISFAKDDRTVAGLLPEFRDEKGTLSVRQQTTCPSKGTAPPIVLRLPATAVGERERKVKAVVAVFGRQGDRDDASAIVVQSGQPGGRQSYRLLELSKPFDVKFPKADRKNSPPPEIEASRPAVASTQSVTPCTPGQCPTAIPSRPVAAAEKPVASDPNTQRSHPQAAAPNLRDAACSDCTSEMGATGRVVDGGVLLTRLDPGGPAELAGLKAGDLIIAVGDHSIRNWADLSSEISLKAPGTTVLVTVLRERVKTGFWVQLRSKAAAR